MMAESLSVNHIQCDEYDRLNLIGGFAVIVESILCPKPINIWHVPGAFQRVHSHILSILSHGCKTDDKGNNRLWNFLLGLRVVCPNLWPSALFAMVDSSDSECVRYWLTISLQNFLLYKQLKIAFEDKERLSVYYEDYASTLSPIYQDAFLIVIQALELNSQAVFAKINPSLMVNYYTMKKQDKDHFCLHREDLAMSPINDPPEVTDVTSKISLNGTLSEISVSSNSTQPFVESEDNLKASSSFLQINYNATSDYEKSKQHDDSYCDDGYSTVDSICARDSNQSAGKPKADLSLNLEYLGEKSDTYHTVGPSPFLLRFLSKSSSKRDVNQRKTSLIPHQDLTALEITENGLDTISIEVNKKNSLEIAKSLNTNPVKLKLYTHTRSRSDGAQPSCSFVPQKIETGDISDILNDKMSNEVTRKPFMEDGGKSITAEADGFFPCPRPGQNLIDFLSSDQFSKASAQLDRENAHFSVAEAVLAAIEQINYKMTFQKPRKAFTNIPDESEEDVIHFRKERHKRRIRLKKNRILHRETSDDDPVTTDYSILDSPTEPHSEESSNEEGTMIEETHSDDFPDSDSLACSNDPTTAENVAIALLSHYNKKLLPKASELQWLVTEQEVPQKLLPIPKSIPVSPDEPYSNNGETLLRGNSEWAPPRPQLILTLHTNNKRATHLVAQKWRCAGCGLKVSEKLSRHFRLCHYLGRFFCTNCHTNKKSIIPAKVLHRWDFKKYFVSNFSYELLIRMSKDPLFHIGTLNPRLYKQSRDLQQVHLYRLQLYHARVYINTCSRAVSEKTLVQSVPGHWSREPHVYSMEDLIAVKNNQFVGHIKQLTMTCINHVSQCEVCLGQGFICEMCHRGDPIFPYQLDAVRQCSKCFACYHFLCFSPANICNRCRRRELREKETMKTDN